MKRILSLVLALSMVLSMFTFAFANVTLPDVEGTEFEAAVSALIELGIVNGYEDNTYRPEKVVTRAEMAKLLVISAGLEKAADVTKGATSFNDVPADHWATGYINVAAQNRYINGYPDGSFQPDATVKYSEAVTMAIRVLGYRSVVESKGQWPTNYIAKATELKTLEDVNYASYNDGATRGNVALIIWNMLRTPIWDVESENESNGLNYSNRDRVTMIDKYFEDYSYRDEADKYVVTEIEVKDGKVTVTVESEEGYAPITSELAKDTNFIDLFGRRVSILSNDKTEEMVMLIPSSNDKTVEGYEEDLVDDGYTIAGDTLTWGLGGADKVYYKGVIDTKKVTKANTAYDLGESIVVKEIKAGKNEKTTVKTVEGTSKVIDGDAIVLIGGKWATAADLEAGDVVTELVADELFIANRNHVEGSFDKVATETDKDGTTYYITVDGEKYEEVLVDEVIEIDDEGEEKTTETLDAIQADKDSKYYDEDVTLYLNFLGEVVRVEFEELDDKAAEGDFYVLTNIPAAWDTSDKDGVKNYIELNGESYEVKSTVEGFDAYKDTDRVNSGDVVFVKFDSKDRVKELILIGSENADLDEEPSEIDGIEDYKFALITSGDVGDDEVLDDKGYIGDFRVTDTTKVVTITGVEDDDDDDDDETIDHYEVDITTGKDALKGVELVIVAVKADEKIANKATFVFAWEDAKNTEKEFGIVESHKDSKGSDILVIDGESYTLNPDASLPANINSAKDAVDTFVAFTENEDIKLVKVYGQAEAEEADIVTEVDGGRVFKLVSDEIVDLDKIEDDFDDYTVIIVTAEEDVENERYDFTDWDEVEYDALRIKKYDRIIVDDENIKLFLVIRGMDYEEEEPVVTPTPDPVTPTPDPVTPTPEP